MFKRKPKAQKVYSTQEIDQLTSSGKPVLVDFYQIGCAPCQVMDGIMNELAREYGPSAHVVKADIANVPEALHKYKIRSTPHDDSPLDVTAEEGEEEPATGQKATPGGQRAVTQRWRASGLVKKDQLFPASRIQRGRTRLRLTILRTLASQMRNMWRFWTLDA